MKKLFSLMIPVFTFLFLAYSCETLFPNPDCAEGDSRVNVSRADGSVCCPEGCDCLSDANDESVTGAEANTAPNDTISVDPTNPGGGDPIDEDCVELTTGRGYVLDAGTDGEMLITLHEGDFDQLKNDGQNILTEENYFTRVYNASFSQFDPYFVTIIKSEQSNTLIRLAYKKEALFVNRISLN
ncbi:MAG: hypothetical protein KDE26_29180 [Bacteroidetes bacterium]|nr:hypothetical protein [Bacteroidota bacterium]